MFLDNHHDDGRLALWCAAPAGRPGRAGRRGSRSVLRATRTSGTGVGSVCGSTWTRIGTRCSGIITDAYRCVAPKKLLVDWIEISTDVWHAYLLVGRLAAMTPETFLAELEPVAAKLLDRHLATAKEWFPHELVPYGRGRDFAKGYEWSSDDCDLGGAEIPTAVRSALYVNLLTEDNLPYYFRDIERMFDDGRCVRHVEPPLDGRRGPPLDRDPRLPDRHPGDRPGAARTGPHGAGVRRRGAHARSRRWSASSTSRCRSWPPASRTATPAS